MGQQAGLEIIKFIKKNLIGRENMMLKNIIKMCPLLPGLLFGVASHSINAAERSLFDVDISLGWQLDRFTASDLSNALNSEESGNDDISGLLDIRVNYLLTGDFFDTGDKL